MKPTIAKQGVLREATCTVCGEQFQAMGHNAKYCSKYCSRTCRNRAVRQRSATKAGQKASFSRGYTAGCIGCVDFALDVGCCDYMLNNGVRRPCKSVLGKGCELYSKSVRNAGAPPALRRFNEDVYRQLYAEGMSDAEAAKRMGLTTLTIWKNRTRLGLPANNGRRRT